LGSRDPNFKKVHTLVARIEEICEELEVTPMELMYAVVGLLCTRFHLYVKRSEEEERWMS